jgi:prepilin-type processing-associated H-X9-DG protein
MDLQELITKLQAILAEHGNTANILYADHNGEEYYIVDVCYKESTNTVVLYEP